MPPKPVVPAAPEPMPAESAVTPEARALALTAWDLARTRADREDTARGQLMTLRTHQKLIAAFEAGRRIPEDDRTFLRVRENARGSFLLIHGMSTGPADLRGLAKHLGDNECNVWVLRLPELGAVPGAVSHASWESSLLQASQRCRMLSRGGGDLHVVGLGYGAALALQLASRLDAISSVVLLAPALMPRVSAFQRQVVRFRLHRLGLFRRMLGLNVDLLEGMDAARGSAGRVRVPVYAAQCDDDDRASPASLRFLQKKVGNRASRFQVFPNGGHAILAAHGERVLYGEILKFCGIR
ncbi:MAG: alpha/beta fold hydrolase [bacterium]|nr:alpha/beta fold hydrolase [bacterium]